MCPVTLCVCVCLSVSGLFRVGASSLLSCRPQSNFKVQQHIQLSVYRELQTQLLRPPGIFDSAGWRTLWGLSGQRVPDLLLWQLSLLAVLLRQSLSAKCQRQLHGKNTWRKDDTASFTNVSLCTKIHSLWCSLSYNFVPFSNLRNLTSDNKLSKMFNLLWTPHWHWEGPLKMKCSVGQVKHLKILRYSTKTQ